MKRRVFLAACGLAAVLLQPIAAAGCGSSAGDTGAAPLTTSVSTPVLTTPPRVTVLGISHDPATASTTTALSTPVKTTAPTAGSGATPGEQPTPGGR